MHSQTAAPSEIERRLERARKSAQQAGVDALIISVGSDLRYLSGYHAHLSERLTAMVIPAVGDPLLICPQLEASLVARCAAAQLGVAIKEWSETDDPYRLVTDCVSGVQLAISDRMWAQHVFGIRDAQPDVRLQTAASVMAQLRMIKSAAELDALARAGSAIDSVHAQVTSMLKVGRTEEAVAADLAEAILAAGHSAVDFTIVGSGPNGASPHHDYSSKVIEDGDLVVIDIGGEMPDGYRSDCTRTYVVGDSTVYDDFYAVLAAAYDAALTAATPGTTCSQIDAAARSVIADAGMGERFIHRTGHGIGLDGHEHPYIVGGNKKVVEAGYTFSIEPGIYLEGQYGARLEDIVSVGERSARQLNNAPRELVHVAG